MTQGHANPWRLLETQPADGALNMAVDELLMEGVREGRPPTLRLYGWAPPCVSLGRNQPALAHYDRDALEAAGVEVVRRPTGGRAVLHDDEITYSVVAPARAFGSARGAYRRINEVLVAAVARIGGAAAMYEGDGRRTHGLTTEPCFAEPAVDEVVAGGRKLIGSAQLCQEGVLLQHGSLPLRRTVALETLPAPLAESLDGRPAYLAERLASPISRSLVARAITEVWESAIGPLEPRGLSPVELSRARELATRYRSSDWTWRR